jgi:membrane protein implicated in regulation of membrane protease activity
MTGGQIAALIFAILLLLPGGCFLAFGIVMLTEGDVANAVQVLQIGVPILFVMGLLFGSPFAGARHRRRAPARQPRRGIA